MKQHLRDFALAMIDDDQATMSSSLHAYMTAKMQQTAGIGENASVTEGAKQDQELTTLINQRKKIQNDIDVIINDGGQVLMNDPLNVRLGKLNPQIDKLKKAGAKYIKEGEQVDEVYDALASTGGVDPVLFHAFGALATGIAGALGAAIASKLARRALKKKLAKAELKTLARSIKKDPAAAKKAATSDTAFDALVAEAVEIAGEHLDEDAGALRKVGMNALRELASMLRTMYDTDVSMADAREFFVDGTGEGARKFTKVLKKSGYKIGSTPSENASWFTDHGVSKRDLKGICAVAA